MRIISRSFHAVLDYASAAILIASPWVFGFGGVTAARNIMLVCGVLVLAMSIFTNYEGGAVKKIAMSTHLWADLFMGAFLAASPWLFFFEDEVYVPFVALGLFSVCVSLLTVNASQVQRHSPIEFVEKGVHEVWKDG